MTTIISLRMRSAARGAGTWIGSALILLGCRIHVGLVDLAFAVSPQLFDEKKPRGYRPSIGVVVLVLLACGLILIGGGSVWLIHEAMSRDGQP